jgi:hypothetical protein
MNAGNELHRFAEAFKSEDDLRKHLATLLTKMPRTQSVQITHGAQEYGKDIVFYAPDAFDNWRVNACVVKKNKISGAVDDNEGARTVFLQAEQALDTPFISGAGQEERVSKVFIISPHDCPQTTINSIQGKLKNHFGKVEFLCGGLLFEKFSKFWPEFVVFESSLLGTYVAALQQAFDQSDPINFLASQHNIFSSADKTIRSVYVKQGFKISLQQFDLLVESPNFSVLDTAGGPLDIESLREQLVFLANLIQHTQVWESPDPIIVAKLVGSLHELSKDLKEAWDHIKKQRRNREQRERDLLWRERDKARILNVKAHIAQTDKRHKEVGKGQVGGGTAPETQESDVAQNRFSKLAKAEPVVKALEVLKAFKTRVGRANGFVKFAVAGNIDLHSEEYLNYLRVREVARLAPEAFRKLSEVKHRHFPESLLNDIHGPTLITAPAGFGKTSFCRWNTLNDVQGLVDKSSNVIPIYVPLHQLATANVQTCEAAFFRNSEILELVSKALKAQRKVRIYLDGLDEVTTIDQQEKLMGLAAQLRAKYSSIQIVVTGRDYVGGPWLRWLSRVHLAELNDKQVEQLIANWLGDNKEEQSSFEKQLSRTRTLKPLMHVPLLGTLTIAVFKKMKSLPESKVKLYEVFVDLMCGGWDLAKNVRRETRFGSQAKLGVLTRLAGILHSNQKREATEEDIYTAVSQTMTSFLQQWRGLLDELIEDGLLVRMGLNSLAFSHLSFQEYLAASELTDPNGTRQQQIIKKFLSGEDWWREVLAFYVAMSKRPDETETWIRRATLDISSSKPTYDLSQRFEFLINALVSAWPAWTPKQAPQLARVTS